MEVRTGVDDLEREHAPVRRDSRSARARRRVTRPVSPPRRAARRSRRAGGRRRGGCRRARRGRRCTDAAPPAQHRDLEQVEAPSRISGREPRAPRAAPHRTSASSPECQMSAACSQVDVSMPSGAGRGVAGIVGVDPRASCAVGGKMRRDGRPMWLYDAGSSRCARARCRSRDNARRREAAGERIARDPVAGEFVDGVGYLAQPRQHRPLPSRTRGIACRWRAPRRRAASGPRRAAVARSADRRIVVRGKRLAGGGTGPGSPRRKVAGQLVQRRGWRACRPGCGRSASASCRRARSARRPRRRAARCRHS